MEKMIEAIHLYHYYQDYEEASSEVKVNEAIDFPGGYQLDDPKGQFICILGTTARANRPWQNI